MPSTPKLRVKGPKHPGSRVTYSSDYLVCSDSKAKRYSPQLNLTIRLPAKRLKQMTQKKSAEDLQHKFVVTLKTKHGNDTMNSDTDNTTTNTHDDNEQNTSGSYATDVLPLPLSQQPISDRDTIVSPSPAAPIPLGVLDFDSIPSRSPSARNTNEAMGFISSASEPAKRSHDLSSHEELDIPIRPIRQNKKLRSSRRGDSEKPTNLDDDSSDEIIIIGETTNNHASDHQSSDSDSDLSSFDHELNQALTSGASASTGSPLQGKYSHYYDACATLPDAPQLQDQKSSEPTKAIESHEVANGKGDNKVVEEDDDDVIIDPIEPLPPQNFVYGGPAASAPPTSLRTRIQVAGKASSSQSPPYERPPFLRFENKSRPLTDEEKLKGYRKIPPTYANVMKRELSLFTDLNNEDELSMIERVIFSLKDPFSGAKIKLPVKSTSCKHFECFDFENFCQINSSKIPYNQISKLKKDLCNKNYESRKLEKLFQEQQNRMGTSPLQRIQINKRGKPPIYTYPQYSEHGQIFHFTLYHKTPPLFKCPVCDQLFGIKQLYISDVFNYFVKVTPKEIDRIELLDMESYRIIDSNPSKPSSSPGLSKKEEVIELTDDDDDDDDDKVVVKKNNVKLSSSDDFNDGLDEVFMKLGRSANGESSKRSKEAFNRKGSIRSSRGKATPGSGSWDDPVTLD